jgi:hypothetical protein
LPSVWTGFRSRRELYHLLVLICVPNPPRLILSTSLNKMPLLRSALPSSPHRGHDTDAAIQMTRVGTKTLLLVSGMEGWACTTECKGRRYVDVGSSCVRRRARRRRRTCRDENGPPNNMSPLRDGSLTKSRSGSKRKSPSQGLGGVVCPSTPPSPLALRSMRRITLSPPSECRGIYHVGFFGPVLTFAAKSMEHTANQLRQCAYKPDLGVKSFANSILSTSRSICIPYQGVLLDRTSNPREGFVFCVKSWDGASRKLQSTKLTSRHFDKNAYPRMNVKLAMQLLSQSTVEMIHYAIADDGVVLSLRNKGMYNHVTDFCEQLKQVIDICNGRHGPHSPDNAVMRQTCLLDTLVWFS